MTSFCECGCGEPAPIATHTHTAAGRVQGQPVRFIHGHNARKTVHYIEEDRGYTSPCWIWQLARQRSGYGLVREAGERLAHRAAYVKSRGPIPDGLHIDHLCQQPPCVNPAHLEAVTPQENNRRSCSPTALNARKTQCPQGHPYDEANTYTSPAGKRHCRACHRRWDQERRAAA